MIPVTLMAKTITARPPCPTGMWSACTMWHPATHTPPPGNGVPPFLTQYYNLHNLYTQFYTQFYTHKKYYTQLGLHSTPDDIN